MWPEEMVFHLLRTNVSYRNASDAAAAVLLPPPRVWPLKAPSLSERFPLRPQGSLIFGEKEPPSLEPAFFKNHLLSPPLSKSVFLSSPSALPNRCLLCPLRFSLGLSRSLPREAGLHQPPGCLSVTYPSLVPHSWESWL